MESGNKQKKILPQLFDIKPLVPGGRPDFLKILKVRKVVDLKGIFEEGADDQKENIGQLLKGKNPISITPKEKGKIKDDLSHEKTPPEESLPEMPPEEEALPTREELLRELAKIDKEDGLI